MRSGKDIIELIQVSSVEDLEDLDRREARSLLRARRETGCEKLTIVTEGLETVLEHDGATIELVPLWKWLLKENGTGTRTSIGKRLPPKMK